MEEYVDKFTYRNIVSLEKSRRNQVPGDIECLKEKLKEEGITFEIYRERKHIGLKTLIEGFQNSMWERDILGETAKRNGFEDILMQRSFKHRSDSACKQITRTRNPDSTN